MSAASDDPYAILGLKPGADLVAIERAFRALIKEHHPDRPGGNSTRAAQLNRAYRDLRERVKKRGDVKVREPLAQRQQGRGAARATWIAALFAIVGSAAWVGSVFTPVAGHDSASSVAARLAERVANGAGRTHSDIMDRPLSLAAINSAVLDASRLEALGDDLQLADETRRCHRDLRLAPEITRFDRCIAFDNAVILLKKLDPERQDGVFGQGAVTGRAWASAQTLSRDYFSTDSRLKQIRVRVELMLAASTND